MGGAVTKTFPDWRRRMGMFCRFLAVLSGMLGQILYADAFEYPIVFVQQPVGEDPAPVAEVASAGSRIVLMNRAGVISVLTDGFVAAADACVSFDGQRILFAGKQKASDSWSIWEMRADGTGKLQVTRGLDDCREPIYLPRAAVNAPNFDNKVRWTAFVQTMSGVQNDRGDGPLTSLFAMNLDPVSGRGTVLWRTTYNLGGDRSPTLLSDGRVVFSARQRGAFALMAISWAGENLNPLYGSHDGGISQVDACEMPDRTVVFVESDETGGGRLACVSLRRPLHTHRVLDADGRYRTPHPLFGDRLLVSCMPKGDTYGIYVFDVGIGQRGQKIYDDPNWHDVDAMPVTMRPVPPARIPTVDFASVLDVGSLRTVGQLQCLNVYESDRPGADEVFVRGAKRVRLVEGVPGSGRRGAQDAAPDSAWPPPGVAVRVLGEAPVEADGSFYVNVAGDVPFYLQILDAEGVALQTMRAWTWVRSGDQRGCIGCHEDKELAPENRATQALVKARPLTLAPPPEARRAVSFVRDVMPILTSRCAQCHSGMAPEAPVLSSEADGRFNRAYTSLMNGSGRSEWKGPYVRPGEARRSALVDYLFNSPSYHWMSDEERRTIISWIDLGARWDSRAAAGGAAGMEP